MKDSLLKCAMWFVGMIGRVSVASGIVYRAADEEKTSHRFSAGLKPSLQLFYSHEHYLRGYQYLLLRCQRLIHPAIELLLVGFDPAINMALNIAF